MPNCTISKPRRKIYKTAPSENPEDPFTKLQSLKTQKTIVTKCTPSKPRRPHYQIALSQNREDNSTELHILKTLKNTLSNCIL